MDCLVPCEMMICRPVMVQSGGKQNSLDFIMKVKWKWVFVTHTKWSEEWNWTHHHKPVSEQQVQEQSAAHGRCTLGNTLTEGTSVKPGKPSVISRLFQPAEQNYSSLPLQPSSVAVWWWCCSEMMAWLRVVLNISDRTSASWSTQALSTWPGILSGPAALRGSALRSVSSRWQRTGRAPGLLAGGGFFHRLGFLTPNLA